MKSKEEILKESREQTYLKEHNRRRLEAVGRALRIELVAVQHIKEVRHD